MFYFGLGFIKSPVNIQKEKKMKPNLLPNFFSLGHKNYKLKYIKIFRIVYINNLFLFSWICN